MRLKHTIRKTALFASDESSVYWILFHESFYLIINLLRQSLRGIILFQLFNLCVSQRYNIGYFLILCGGCLRFALIFNGILIRFNMLSRVG